MGTRKLTRKIQRHRTKENKMTKRGTYFFNQVMESLALIGKCHCGKGSLFSVIGIDNHYFNYYCFECGSIGDIRIPKKNDIFLTDKEKAPTPVSLLQFIFKQKSTIELTDEMVKNEKIDEDVNQI